MAYACRIPIRTAAVASCARFLVIVEPTDIGAERLNRVKAGRKMPKNLCNYMHLSVLQGKTSLLQIVIHSFFSFSIVYIFYFADHFSSICLSRHCLQFDFDLVIRVVCFVCIGPFKYTGPIDIALSLFASYNSHSALRITKYLRAYWQWKTLMKCAYSIHSRVRRQWKTLMSLWSQDYAYASLISHCKQNAMRCQICI